jgi:hypothetical protein
MKAGTKLDKCASAMRSKHALAKHGTKSALLVL